MGDSTNRNSHQRNLGHCRRSHLNLRIPSACRDSVADQHALLRWIPYNVKFFSLLNACELLTYTLHCPLRRYPLPTVGTAIFRHPLARFKQAEDRFFGDSCCSCCDGVLVTGSEHGVAPGLTTGLFYIIFGGLLQFVFSLIFAVVLRPILAMMACFASYFIMAVRVVYDFCMFRCVLKSTARVPISNSSSAWRVSGPGMASNLTISITKEGAFELLKASLRLQVASRLHRSQRGNH